MRQRFWIACLPRPDISHCLKIGTFGLSRRIGSVKEGDKIIFCAGKGEWKIIAQGTATTDYYLDDKPIFLSEARLFEDRFDIKTQKLSKEVDLIPMLDKLSIITNMAYWSVYFRNAIVEITEKDWNVIQEKIAAA